MPLTRKFKDTIQSRALRDAKFRRALLTESIELMLEGDLRTGKAMLRDYINATIGFEKLARQLKKSPKSVMRMFSDSGNPRADNIFSIISALGKREGIALQVTGE